MTERDIIRRLQDSPVPPPPEDLAARIINDIPDEIEIHPDLAPAQPVRPFIHRRPVWLAVAAAAAVALTAAVTWELRNERPTDAAFSQTKRAEVVEQQHRLEVSPQATADEEIAATPAPLAEGGKPNNTWAMVGVVEDDVLANEADDVRTPIEADANAELKKQASGRQEDTEVRRPALFADQSPVKVEGSVEELSFQQKTMGTGASPTAPPVSNLPRSGGANGVGTSQSKPDVTVPSAEQRRAAPQVAGRGSSRQRSIATEREETKSFADQESIVLASPPPEPPPQDIVVTPAAPLVDIAATHGSTKGRDQDRSAAPPSTGGTAEPNDKPYGDVFFEPSGVNPFVDSEDDALSTFGLDVDTGSYTVARRYLHDGNLPPREAIRVEEFVNSFDYGDPAPRREDFSLTAEGAPSAFMHGERYYTLRLAVKARDVNAADRPPAVLVFCIDVSGSMARENRLELVKKALHELLENLRRDDHVGLVIYGSTGEVVLRPTTNHDEIRRAIDRLQSGGSTNAEEGLSLAYDLLDDGDNDGRIRRVILCSDGVANVGRTGPDSILERIRSETGEGIELTTVGFGMGNYNDALMERLADAGDGRYAYVDDLSEARRIFVEELTGTLFTLGREAKAQVEFDPEVVSRWRLLGYENRDIADERFRDPTVDAGEIGAGHTVTVLYEVKLSEDVSRNDTVATLRFRYRPAGRDDVVEMDERLRYSDLAKSWEKASRSLKLASLVAEFAELLKGTYWAKDGSLEDVLNRLQHLQPEFAGDARVAELTGLVAEANRLQPGS